MAWYNPSWLYRVKITVDADEVDADLTNFPVYVNLAGLPAGFHAHVKSDGGDIRVTTADQTTEIAREVVVYDAGTDTGELHFLAPSLANATDTDFYIYYGNSGASDYGPTDTYGSEAVWADYLYVSHDGGLVDSAGNLTPTNISTTTTAGKVGTARVFNGSSTYVDLNSTTLLSGATNASIQSWVRITGSLNRDYPIVSKWNGSGWVFFFDDVTTTSSPSSATDTICFAASASDGAGGRVNGASSLVTQNTWAFITSTFQASTAIRMYKDGVQSTVMTSSVVSAVVSDSIAAYVGNSPHASSIKWFQGELDEIRTRASILSADWIAAEYSNQNAPGTFYAVGTEEANTTSASISDIQSISNINTITF